MTNEEKKKLYAALSAPFTDDAIERTEGRLTGRGYDTTGIKYQYVVNRLNEVLGIGSYRAHRTVNVKEIQTSKGRPAFEAICDITLELGAWVDGEFVVWAESLADGGHVSMSEADARKGAYTNAFKKAAAFFGVGKQAYEGTLDDDNIPADQAVVPAAPASDEKPVASAPQVAPKSQSKPQGQHVQQHEEARDATPATSNGATGGNRNRLTSKQLAAIWALARKLNYAQSQFRQHVKQTYGVQPEFLDKNAASTLIGQLSARASNGHSHPAGERGAEA